MKQKTAIGLMSGTSMDGIDVALIRTDGRNEIEFGESLAVEYSPVTKRKIEAAFVDAIDIEKRNERPGLLSEVEALITDQHVDAVNVFLKQHCIEPANVDVIGFHGQTILHRPEVGLTVQLGLGDRLAADTGIDVVFDMRAADMMVGGQGAPLVPVFHQAIANNFDQPTPLCFVNIGGISNITYIDDDLLIAFDAGPGNALIDQWVQSIGGVPYDQGGRIASEGRVNAAIAGRYLASPYFDQAVPKSLDRNDFSPLESGAAELSDGARTLSYVSASSIYKSCDHLPKKPKTWIICGGGRLNDVIVHDLIELSNEDKASVFLSEEVGLQGDMLEAQAFAYLAVRSLESLPLTFPSTTGCREPVTGGVLARHRPRGRVS